MPNPYFSAPEASPQPGAQTGGSRPEAYSSPGSAKAPLVSRPDGAYDHRAITKGVANVTRKTLGKAGAKTTKGFIGGTPATKKSKGKTKKKRTNK